MNGNEGLPVIHRIQSFEESPTDKAFHESEQPESSSCCSMLDVNYPKDSFRALFKKREGGIRHVVIMLVILFGLHSLQCMGVKLVSVSYARNEFEWHSTDNFNEWWSSYSSIQVSS